MRFSDEFEFVASNSKTYFFEVEGHQVNDEFTDELTTLLSDVTITDEDGNEVETDDEMFSELNDEALAREYQLEDHSISFDYYGDHNEL